MFATSLAFGDLTDSSAAFRTQSAGIVVAFPRPRPPPPPPPAPPPPARPVPGAFWFCVGGRANVPAAPPAESIAYDPREDTVAVATNASSSALEPSEIRIAAAPPACAIRA